MATLLLTTVGTALGGPIGGALGAFAGRALDNEIFGSGGRQGPRLDELTVSASSYGTPIPRQFGAMRCAGSVIWATDLSESSETSGGKGKPKTTTFSYSTSFAVALSSRPILGIGRIWANGVIVRNALGDLTVDGTIRIHTGHGDQAPDERILAQVGPSAPGFRGLAYVMFEDLQLAEFGNRIPALNVEVFADDSALTVHDILTPASSRVSAPMALPQLAGFSDQGGPIRQTLDVLHTVYPMSAYFADGALTIDRAPQFDSAAKPLPEAVTSPENSEFGPLSGFTIIRETAPEASPQALRYYDIGRDYLPGVQRSAGRALNQSAEPVQFPGALSADAAKNLIESKRHHSIGGQNGLRWRIAEIDPDLRPGRVVTVPGQAGKWSVQSSEWRENGVELELTRLLPKPFGAGAGDSGTILHPPERVQSPTVLRVFELPWDGSGSSSQVTIFAAASAIDGTWSGAALFSEAAGQLDPIGNLGPAQNIGGTLTASLTPSVSRLFEPDAAVRVTVHNTAMILAPTDMDGLARGENTVLVGRELLQFASAEQVTEQDWILRGLLRGRGGTEAAALNLHEAGTQMTLIDRTLTTLDSGTNNFAAIERISAIGRGDPQPATAIIENRGLMLRPLTPVHGKFVLQTNGGLALSWIRRARGAWQWLDGVDAPLNEERELYCVGVGPVSAPVLTWQTSDTQVNLPGESLGPFAGAKVWVQQIGSHAKSAPLSLGTLP